MIVVWDGLCFATGLDCGRFLVVWFVLIGVDCMVFCAWCCFASLWLCAIQLLFVVGLL